MKNLNYLFWAYTIIWVALAAYILTLSVRLRAVSSQLRRLKDRLPER
ncbi:MAG TPA: CcmD family protein [Candidatus Polarisedimenticolia bacterium]|nr:CcmD family protein [Candidatus Polarisedimenticolia bacterium]